MKLQNLQILDLRSRGVTVTSQNVLQICSVKRCILRPGFNNVNMRRQMKKKKKKTEEGEHRTKTEQET